MAAFIISRDSVGALDAAGFTLGALLNVRFVPPGRSGRQREVQLLRFAQDDRGVSMR